MKPKPTSWTENEKRELARLVRSGASTREISAKLGRYARSIRLMAKEMKLLLKKS